MDTLATLHCRVRVTEICARVDLTGILDMGKSRQLFGGAGRLMTLIGILGTLWTSTFGPPPSLEFGFEALLVGVNGKPLLWPTIQLL